MKHPLAVSAWFICCVSIGLALAWLDGTTNATGVLKTATVAIAFGLSVAAAAWLWHTLKK